METLELLGTALGLGALAGLNLYLTVFVAGLAIRLQWITLSPEYTQLAILGDPIVILIAGTLYALEFFADKVPWVDSLWDLVHSLIRPIGGAFLAIMVLGEATPVFDVIVGLLAGSVALSTHSMKAGARLIANSSPEPFSNVALSVTEDVAVVGGLALVYLHPAVALLLVILTVGLIIYFGPRLLRAIRSTAWLAWRKLTAPVDVTGPSGVLPRKVSPDADLLLHELVEGDFVIRWALPCLSMRNPRHAFGYLVALEGEQDRLYFVGKGWLRKHARRLDLAGYKVTHDSRFLSENLTFYAAGRKERELFCFDRSCRVALEQEIDSLARSLRPPADGPLPDGLPA